MDLINKYRSTLNGREVNSSEISKIISESPDRSLRQQAYESRIPLNKIVVENGFIQLLHLRQELALASGHDGFISYRLEEDE